MQDFLRDEDPLSRTERRRVRASAAALSAKGLTGYRIPPATVSLDQIPVRCLAPTAQPAFTLRAEVREARQCLSPRENRVIELLYDFGWQSRRLPSNCMSTRVASVRSNSAQLQSFVSIWSWKVDGGPHSAALVSRPHGGAPAPHLGCRRFESLRPLIFSITYGHRTRRIERHQYEISGQMR